jgi:choline dehydrogenase
MASSLLRSADYVVVGAGSAGCVVAARLTEDPGVEVVLLEAGGPDDVDELHLPAALYRLFKSAYDWNYATTPQTHLANRRLYWPRGKTLGGSSSINAMLYVRGNRIDYDDWAAAGATGWAYADLLPYFRKAEDNIRGSDEFHGADGPLRVEDQRYPHELSRVALESCQAAGIGANDDFNGAEQDGSGFFQVTQRAGRRWSTADGYLRPAQSRTNLTVVTDALAHRVVIESGRAVGVQYEANGEVIEVRAEREVILCGGAINSPQLLMLSGVGPADHLTELGITVVVDQPAVGAQLQDHPQVPAQVRTEGLPDLFAAERPGPLVRWFARHTGPLTSPVAEVGAFLRTEPASRAPDIQFHIIPAILCEHGLRSAPAPGLTVCVTLIDVASRGQVRLASADPRHRPLIDARYLAEPVDRDRLVAGLDRADDVLAKRPLRRYLRDRLGPPIGDPAARNAYLERELQTLYHPTSTCRLGPNGDDVVDLSLRVRGVLGLRVVDASVLPKAPRGNTNAPTIAVAERAADLIKVAS